MKKFNSDYIIIMNYDIIYKYLFLAVISLELIIIPKII